MKLSKIITKAIGGVVVLVAAWAVSSAAIAADTHDYSTYIRLKSDVTCNGGYPGADKWNPEGVMSNECCYLVPTDRKLTSNTKGGQVGGTWPGMELAIQGQLNIYGGESRSYCATNPPLALLPGGKLSFGNYAYSTANADTLDIRGTAENPSLIEYNYTSTGKNSYLYYPQLNIAFTGDEDSVVRFRYTGANANASDFHRAFRVKDGFANFFGTVIVDGTRTWLRPETSATTFDIGGTLWVTNGANVYIDTVSPTFGSLVLASDATLQIAANKTVTVTNSISLAEGAKITVDSVTSTAFVYDDGSNSPPEIPVLAVCGAANAAAVDRDALLAAIAAGGVFKNSLASGIPRLVLVESARADGGVDFKVSHAPIVRQKKSCGSNDGPYGYNQYADYLSDGSEISSTKDYYTSGSKVYFKTPYPFPGRSWSINGMVGFYGYSSLTVSDLRLLDGAWFRQMDKNSTVNLYGAATLYGAPNFRVNGSGMFRVYSTLAGKGDLIVSLDVFKCRDKGSDYLGTLSLEGDNSAWSGRALVGCGKEASEDEGLTNLTLRATSSTSLGGAMDAFTFDGVKVADTCTLSITDTATFDAANRGWCFMDGATVSVAANKTATMGESVTFGGASVKKGAGTLMLGGSAKFYDSVNDEAADTPNGATFLVSAGKLGVVSTNALNGVGVSFAAGTALLVDPLPADADLRDYGAVNTKSGVPFASAQGGAIPVVFLDRQFPDTAVSVVICTVSQTAAETLQFDVPGTVKRRKCTVTTRSNPDGTVSYVANFSAKAGFILSVY